MIGVEEDGSNGRGGNGGELVLDVVDSNNESTRLVKNDVGYDTQVSSFPAASTSQRRASNRV